MSHDAHKSGLERLRQLVQEDPEAAAVYRDAQRRDRLFESMRATRRRSGLDQSAVAEAMGTTQSAVSDLENGRVDPRLSTLQRYARALDAAISVDLISDDLQVLTSAGAAEPATPA
jgi:DNA-binding XRE family transcriptional regulator